MSRKNPFESQLERLARTLTEQFGMTVLCQGDVTWIVSVRWGRRNP